MCYKCKKCGLGVIVVPNKGTIRACNCKKVIIKKYLFGLIKIKVETDEPETIVMDLEGAAYGRSRFKG